MRIVVQRVKGAKLSVNGDKVAEIKKGLVIYVCFENGDFSHKDDLYSWAKTKLLNLRVFEDDCGKTNLSVSDVDGEFLFVSQFTLAGDVTHGYRPSFTMAAEKKQAETMFDEFCSLFDGERRYGRGVFGADMTIEQINDGPFTLIVDKRY